MKLLKLSEKKLPFDLDLSLSCGQIFGWKRDGDTWKGVHDGSIVTIRQKENLIYYEGLTKNQVIRFLGLEDPMDEIIGSIRNHIISYNHEPDQFFEEKYARSEGIRILRQNPWECLVSFICSANSNVRTISRRISLILEETGTSCGINSNEHVFPDPGRLAGCSETGLRRCLTGYRAPYLIKTAAFISSHPGFLDQVKEMEYKSAKEALMVLPGVGPKVADCVLLFAFNHLNAVPVDTRIRSIIEEHYAVHMKVGHGRKISYDTIGNFCREYFGPYAGYAQQFLYATRDNEKIK